jgi:alpha-glucosidase
MAQGRPGEWWRRGVVYQVYPRSFQDSNGDGIGDLQGIVSRLDHLNDGTPGSLGIDAIWLSPFYPSPLADFGYDVSDYLNVHPDYGTLADFDLLLREAHRRGIRVIVDFVPNHTSAEHPWFRSSRSSRDDPKRGWYVWRDPRPDSGRPNNWESNFGAAGPAWTLDERTGQYYLHSFLAAQPDLDWWNPDVRRAMEDALRFWLDRGVDGFRIDVAHKMSRDPDLRDNVPGVPPGGFRGSRQRYDEDWPGVHDILRSFRRLIDAYDDRVAVGEVAINDPERVARYYGERLDELHMAFNFDFLKQPWRSESFFEATNRYEQLVPPGAQPVYVLSNHDSSRARSRYAGGDPALGLRRARVAAMLLLALRGTPFVYQGEEIGQADGEVPPGRVLDIAGRDPERTPMQWEPGPGAGFTTGEPWLPIGREADTVNVAAQRDDPSSMLSLYRRLLWFRRSSPALNAGSYQPIAGEAGVFAWVRVAQGQRLLVALNFRPVPASLDAAALGLPGTGTLEVSTDPGRPIGRVDLAPLRLEPDEGMIVAI